MNLIRVKRGFTLIELIIVIALISSTYFLVFSNNSFSVKKNETKLDFYNLKEYLLSNFEFKNELKFSCIEEDLMCYIIIDGKINENLKIQKFLKKIPDVYKYNADSIKVDFAELKINYMNYKVIFELKIDKDYKTNEFIVDTQDNVLIFNSIFTRPIAYKTLNESLEVFNINKTKVKDAF